MNTSSVTRPARPPWHSPDRAVVAGVDGSAHNAAAIEYAAQLAERTHRTLRLTAVVDGRAVPTALRLLSPGAPAWGASGFALDQDRARVVGQHPGVRVAEHVREGSPVSALVAAAREESALVVGRQRVGTTGRVLGSTSAGVAGRSLVPVVIVPDEWRGAADSQAPIVVALQPETPAEAVLDYTFTEAQETGAPVVVVLLSQPEDLTACIASLASCRAFHPNVRVTVIEPMGTPLTSLLGEASHARLLVIGRAKRGPRGLGLSSLARGVLHKAEVPVAVVPA